MQTLLQELFLSNWFATEYRFSVLLRDWGVKVVSIHKISVTKSFQIDPTCRSFD